MPDEIRLLDVVALVRDLPDHLLVRGQVGTVVEVFGTDTFEIEFSDNHGRTYALIPVRAEDLLVLHNEPVQTVRP